MQLKSIRLRTTPVFLFFICSFPLYSTPLRDEAETYFYSTHWGDIKELTVSPLPQPFRADTMKKPMQYAGNTTESDINPILAPLGILDYQSISEELLQFYDRVAEGFLKTEIDSQLFYSEKPFLPHLSRFILKQLPKPETVFYSRPVFDEEGNATAQFKLTQKKLKSTPSQLRTEKIEQPKNNRKETHTHIKEKKTQSLSPALPQLYQKAQAVICEVAAIYKEKRWYIDHIDIKGAEYADSAHTN